MIRANEGDYEQDGILYCGQCHTRKQVRVNVLGQEKLFYCLCKCETAKRDEEQQKWEEQQRQERLKELKRMGFADYQLRKWTFENTEELEKTRIAKNYAENFETLAKEGKGLLLYGPPGTGKSVMAACIVNDLTDKGYPCLMTTITKIDDALRGMYDDRQSYIEGLNKFRLLVIDDLGAERDTEYMNEIAQSVIDSRCRAGLPLIVTTNYSAEKMKSDDIKKARMFSRIWEMCVPIKVGGKDRRKAKMALDYERFLGILEM